MYQPIEIELRADRLKSFQYLSCNLLLSSSILINFNALEF